MNATAARRTIAVSLMVFGAVLAAAPCASAEPDGTPGPGNPNPVFSAAPGAPAVSDPAVPPAGVPAAEPVAGDLPEPAAPAGDNPSVLACRQFSAALNYAAVNYEDFAYATAGGGNYVDYANQQVQSSNVVGRTALREAASTAWGAATTPGLPGDIADPMRSWSLRATKLLLVMGVHGGGDTLNDTANALNDDAHNAQMACALAGSRA